MKTQEEYLVRRANDQPSATRFVATLFQPSWVRVAIADAWAFERFRAILNFSDDSSRASPRGSKKRGLAW